MFDHLTLVLAQNDATPPPPREPADTAAPGANGDGAATGEGADGGPTPPPPPGGNQQPGSPFNSFTIMMLLMIGVFFFIMMSGQRREKKKRAQVLASLKKGVKVQTVGGIRGTIAEVRDNEIVVKVDENSNTRLRFSREAVQGVIEDKTEKEEA